MNKTTYIYHLCDEVGYVFYVGKSNRPKRRIHLHKKKYGKNIQLEVIDEVSIQEWKFWEKYYISLYKSWGFILLNKNDGGGGPTSWNQDLKDKISKTLKERNHKKYYTKEIREKMSNASRGAKRPGTSEKMKGKSNFKDHKHTQSTKDKMSKSRKGKIVSNETREKISNKMKLDWENNPNMKNRILPKEKIKLENIFFNII